MTPQEAVSAFFNTMRSETDQAGLMYSQFAVVQALDYVIDRWEDLNPLARDKAGNRTREWLEDLETVFGGMSTEELCAHKFDFSAELRDIADRGFRGPRDPRLQGRQLPARRTGPRHSRRRHLRLRRRHRRAHQGPGLPLRTPRHEP